MNIIFRVFSENQSIFRSIFRLPNEKKNHDLNILEEGGKKERGAPSEVRIFVDRRPRSTVTGGHGPGSRVV